MLRCLLWILVSFPLSLLAEPSTPPQDLFQNGLAAYQNKKFEEARDFFQKALEQNNHSPHLLHNLALTHFQLNQKPQAIAFWRRALAMDPSYRAARAGRDLLESRTNMRAFERDSLQAWMARFLQQLSIFEVLWLTAFTMTLAGWLWIRYFSARRLALDQERSLPDFPTAALLIFLVFAFCAGLVAMKWNEHLKVRATVIGEHVSARSLPAEDAVGLFDLAAGNEVLVQRENGGWSQVQTGEGSAGWVKDADLMVTSER